VRFGGDPDGAGGIPFTGGPSDFGAWHSELITDGIVIEVSGAPIAGAFVVITDTVGVVATAVTDGSGTFCVKLPVDSGLELSLPTEGVVGIPVQAGEPILIILR
jgi:hypothetical protein